MARKRARLEDAVSVPVMNPTPEVTTVEAILQLKEAVDGLGVIMLVGFVLRGLFR